MLLGQRDRKQMGVNVQAVPFQPQHPQAEQSSLNFDDIENVLAEPTPFTGGNGVERRRCGFPRLIEDDDDAAAGSVTPADSPLLEHSPMAETPDAPFTDAEVSAVFGSIAPAADVPSSAAPKPSFRPRAADNGLNIRASPFVPHRRPPCRWKGSRGTLRLQWDAGTKDVTLWGLGLEFDSALRLTAVLPGSIAEESDAKMCLNGTLCSVNGYAVTSWAELMAASFRMVHSKRRRVRLAFTSRPRPRQAAQRVEHLWPMPAPAASDESSSCSENLSDEASGEEEEEEDGGGSEPHAATPPVESTPPAAAVAPSPPQEAQAASARVASPAPVATAVPAASSAPAIAGGQPAIARQPAVASSQPSIPRGQPVIPFANPVPGPAWLAPLVPAAAAPLPTASLVPPGIAAMPAPGAVTGTPLRAVTQSDATVSLLRDVCQGASIRFASSPKHSPTAAAKAAPEQQPQPQPQQPPPQQQQEAPAAAPERKAPKGPYPDFMDPRGIRFSQSKISSVFNGGKHRGMTLEETADMLISGELTADKFPRIQVFHWPEGAERNPGDEHTRRLGCVFSCDNRRLWVYKTAGVRSVPVRWIEQSAVDPAKLSSDNGGVTIEFGPRSAADRGADAARRKGTRYDGFADAANPQQLMPRLVKKVQQPVGAVAGTAAALLVSGVTTLEELTADAARQAASSSSEPGTGC